MFAANQKSRLSLHLTSCQSVSSKSQELFLVFCEEQWLSSLKGRELLQRLCFTLSATQGVLHRSLQTTNQITKFLRRIPMNKQQDASLINMCISKRKESKKHFSILAKQQWKFVVMQPSIRKLKSNCYSSQPG